MFGKNGGTISGLELQTAYYLAARQEFWGSDEETDWILQEWLDVLTLLPADRSQLVGRLDWVTKLRSGDLVREERLGWDDPWLASLDLEYHNINPDQGLFLGLEAEGKTFASPATATSRARSRHRATRRNSWAVRPRFRDQIKSVQWERVQFKGMLIPKVLEMGDLFEPEAVKELSYILETAVSPAEAIEAWDQRKEYAP